MITWDGQELFVGANVAWKNWAWDFTSDGNGGIASRMDEYRVVFDRAKSMSARILRWWLMPGAQTDANGNTRWFDADLKLRQGIFTDIDAALALAEEYDVYLHFCLFSGPQDIKAWIDAPESRVSLMIALSTLFEHYKDHKRIVTWEFCNETDIGIWYKGANEANTVAAVTLFAKTAKAYCPQFITTSCGMVDGLKLFANCGLTLYQAHWYPYMDNGGTSRGDWYLPGRTRVGIDTQYGTDPAVPLIVGEFYAGETNTDPSKHWQTWQNNGFDAACAWSLMWESTNDKMQIDYAVAKAFAAGEPLPVPTPTPEPAPTPTPTPIGHKKRIHKITTTVVTETWEDGA